MLRTNVPATAEGMPKFNMRQIMSDAWMLYRRNFTAHSRPAGKERRRRAWKAALRNAWMWARQARVEALKSVAEKAADRVRELTAELMRIDARPWGMSSYQAVESRSVLIAEIAAVGRA